MTERECVSFLREHDAYLIITHTRPDGDTLCSAGALCSALRRAGKTAYLYPNRETTEKYLPYVGGYFAPEGYVHQTVVSVDTADVHMFAEGFAGTVDLAIDHHGSNSGYAPLTLVRPDYAACGELILELTRELCGSVTQEEATLLYIAIATDTGCFQYMNTNAHTMRCAAETMELGAPNGALNVTFFRSVPQARIVLEGMIYREMRFFRDGKIVIAPVTQQMMDDAGVTENDLDDLAGLAGRPEGSIVSVTLKEKENGTWKVSMRSKPEVNVSDLCARFGGGGHAMAAGCAINGDLETVIRLILAAIDEEWPA